MLFILPLSRAISEIFVASLALQGPPIKFFSAEFSYGDVAFLHEIACLTSNIPVKGIDLDVACFRYRIHRKFFIKKMIKSLDMYMDRILYQLMVSSNWLSGGLISQCQLLVERIYQKANLQVVLAMRFSRGEEEKSLKKNLNC